MCGHEDQQVDVLKFGSSCQNAQESCALAISNNQIANTPHDAAFCIREHVREAFYYNAFNFCPNYMNVVITDKDFGSWSSSSQTPAVSVEYENGTYKCVAYCTPNP